MGFFSAGDSAAGDRPIISLAPAKSASNLSPLALPFNVNMSTEFVPKGFSTSSSGGSVDRQSFGRDFMVVSPNPSSDYSFPHGGASEGFRAYGNDSNLLQGGLANPSTTNLYYGLECPDWLRTEIQDFVTDSYPYSISEGATGIPTSVVRRVPIRGVSASQLSEPASMEACNVFVDPMYSFSTEDAKAQYNSSESSGRASSSLHKGMLYSQTLNPISLESCRNFDSESSYGRYITTVDSGTIDPMAYYYPATTRSSSFQLSAPSSCGTSSHMGISPQKDKSFALEDLYTINADYVDWVPVKESKMSQNFEAKKVCDEISRMNSVGKYSTSYFPLGHESAIRKPIIQSTEANSGMEIKHLDLPNAFTSHCALTEPVDGPSRDSSGSLDQTVDSPCWKGASVSQQSPFSSLVPEFLHSAGVESGGCNDFGKCEKHLPVTAGCLESLSSSEQFGKLICNDKIENSLIYNLQQSCSFMPITQKMCKDICKAPSDYQKETQHSVICKEENIEVRNDKEREPGENDYELSVLGQERVISSNQSISTAGTHNHRTSYKGAVQGSSSKCQPLVTDLAPGDIVEPIGSSLVMAKDTPLSVVLGKLQYLSAMLASSDDFGSSELKDHDHKLLQSVIDNLRAFALKNNKDLPKENFHDNEPKAAQSKMTGLKGSCVMNQSNIKISNDMNGSMHSIGSRMNDNELDNMAFSSGASHVSKDQDVIQAFQKIQMNSYGEQEEKVHSAVYKKLWIDAEAALCSMKYKLELVQMKAETENCQQTEALLPRMKHVHSEHEALLKSDQSKPLVELASDDEIDPSVMARINVLIGRHDKPSSDIRDIDPSVMARLNVLKGRDELSSSMSAEHHQNMTMQTNMCFTEGTGIETAALNTGEDPGRGLSFFETAAARCLQPSASGSGSQSHASTREAKQIIYGGQGNSSSSSEWEHMIMEELN